MGENPTRSLSLRPVALGAVEGGNNFYWSTPREKGSLGTQRACRPQRAVNVKQASKRRCGSRPVFNAGKAAVLREVSDKSTAGFHRGVRRWHACKGKLIATREASLVAARDRQRMFREEPNPAKRGGGEVRSSDELG